MAMPAASYGQDDSGMVMDFRQWQLAGS